MHIFLNRININDLSRNNNVGNKTSRKKLGFITYTSGYCVYYLFTCKFMLIHMDTPLLVKIHATGMFSDVSTGACSLINRLE